MQQWGYRLNGTVSDVSSSCSRWQVGRVKRAEDLIRSQAENRTRFEPSLCCFDHEKVQNEHEKNLKEGLVQEYGVSSDVNRVVSDLYIYFDLRYLQKFQVNLHFKMSWFRLLGYHGLDLVWHHAQDCQLKKTPKTNKAHRLNQCAQCLSKIYIKSSAAI